MDAAESRAVLAPAIAGDQPAVVILVRLSPVRDDFGDRVPEVTQQQNMPDHTAPSEDEAIAILSSILVAYRVTLALVAQRLGIDEVSLHAPAEFVLHEVLKREVRGGEIV